MTGKWFIKTHQGEELGPFGYSTLLDMLSAPPYSENATLIRPEWRDAWKPALSDIPSLMDIGVDEQAGSGGAACLPAGSPVPGVRKTTVGVGEGKGISMPV